MKTNLISILFAGATILLGSAIAYAGGPPPNQVLPEPATLALFGAGLAGLAVYGFIRKRKK